MNCTVFIISTRLQWSCYCCCGCMMTKNDLFSPSLSMSLLHLNKYRHFDIGAHDEDESFKNYWEMRGFITSYWWCAEHALLMPCHCHTHTGIFWIHMIRLSFSQIFKTLNVVVQNARELGHSLPPHSLYKNDWDYRLCFFFEKIFFQ